MTSPLVANGRRVHVQPVPACEPPVLSADEALSGREPRYHQDPLALDFLADADLGTHRRHTDHGALPEPTPVVASLAQALVEVMAGLRPPTQVSRWTSPGVYAALCRRSAVAARRGPSSRRPAVVVKVRVQEPATGVVEAAAVVVHHDRVRALALRLIGLDRRWVVSELSIG